MVLGAAGRFKHAEDTEAGTGAFAGFLGGANPGDFTFTARATVLDDDSGALIEGAALRLESTQGRSIVAGVSDHNGECVLVIHNTVRTLSALFGEYWREVPYQVRAVYQGYSSFSGLLIREDNSDVDILIVMADGDAR